MVLAAAHLLVQLHVPCVTTLPPSIDAQPSRWWCQHDPQFHIDHYHVMVVLSSFMAANSSTMLLTSNSVLAPLSCTLSQDVATGMAGINASEAPNVFVYIDRCGEGVG